uniref:J domain-containing protein n=1 Tax=uncultured Sphingomonas sp. TaxID=158754 RepID=UPI0025DD7B7F|nr:J domain-containing protein [uncultured Sphingomonas sp.]
MRERRSPHTVLGLRPGADRAAVDEAFRRLMKQRHPDLRGGDPAAAAELNDAYAALKAETARVQPVAALPVAKLAREPRGRRRGRLGGLLMVAMAGAGLFFAPVPDLPRTQSAQRTLPPPRGPDAEPGPVDMPDLRSLPDEEAVAAAVAAAQRLRAQRLDGEAVNFSRSCEEELKTYASLSLLDHCVAFDAASGMLGGASPDARFRAEDMAARHVGAALRVSDDPVLAEDRIGSVRRQVERLLLPPPADQGVPAGGAVETGAAGLGATGSAG